MNVLAELRSRFSVALAPLCSDPAPFAAMVKPVQDPKFGDYQANCAMPLAKQLGQNPRELAARIVEGLQVDDLCETPEIAGPGFINLRLRQSWLEHAAAEVFSDPRLGVAAVAEPRRIVLDYSAPNVAKPMHVGHLRSTVIGDALYRLLGFMGHRVTSDNHLGDWGTQFGMIIFGYKNFLDAARYAADPVKELARMYRLVNQLSDYQEVCTELPQWVEQRAAANAHRLALEMAVNHADKSSKEALKRELRKLTGQVDDWKEKIAGGEARRAAVDADPELLKLAQQFPEMAVAAREETARLHAGDPENRRLWEQFMPPCLAAIGKMYDRLSVRFDLTLGESFYQPLLGEVVADLSRRGIARESDGAICVFMPDVDAPFIIRKRDGAFTYATTDLATIQYRQKELKAQSMLYVVDARQGDHFKLLFETARRWGFAEIELRHISFGTILGDDKRPFKTRSGDTVGLESLLDESIVRARKIIEASDNAKPQGPELDDAARGMIAEAVGLGAIKYADLSQNRESDYVFSWEKMLATNGDSGTYMQYAYARVCGIFRKGQVDRSALRQSAGASGSPTLQITSPAERALLLQLLRYSEALQSAAQEYRPNFLTQYLFETANCFSTFFEQCPVLKADTEELRTSRLRLCDLTARIISHGLELLGIKTLEQM